MTSSGKIVRCMFSPAALLVAAFLITVTIVESSVFMRLQEVGAGCPDWPQCYGSVQAVERGVSYGPLRKIHRNAAALLVLISGVLACCILCNANYRSLRSPFWLMITVIVALAIIGPFTPKKEFPIFAAANGILGVFLLLTIAVLWWRYIRFGRRDANGRLFYRWSMASLYLAIMAIIAGFWGSSNYSLLPRSSESAEAVSWVESFNPLRRLPIDNNGRAQADGSQLSIRIIHRLAAFALAVAILSGCLLLLIRRPECRLTALIILILTMSALWSGWRLVSSPALPIAMAHHFVAVLLVLVILRLVVSGIRTEE